MLVYVRAETVHQSGLQLCTQFQVVFGVEIEVMKIYPVNYEEAVKYNEANRILK